MLYGESVILRAHRRDDVAALQRVLRDDVETVALMEDAPWVPHSLEMAQARFDKRLAEDPAKDAVWLIVQRRDDPDGQAVGEAGLWGIDLHLRRAHLGIVLARDARRSGLGTDVLRVLCDYAFRVRALNRQQVDTLAANAAMNGSAEAVGFQREGLLRSACWLDGTFVDEVILGLLSAEWFGSAPEKRQSTARLDHRTVATDATTS